MRNTRVNVGAVIGSVVGLFLVIGLILLPFSIANVPANHVGVVYNGFGGGVQEKTLANGFYFKKPFFDKIYKIPTDVQTVNLDKVTTQTHDGQYIDTSVDVKYQILGDDALTVFKQFREVDRVNKELVKPVVQRAVEQVTVDYDVFDILGPKRNEVYKQINDNVRNELQKFGLTFKSLTILDSDAKDEIELAIQNEAVAQKAIDVAKQEQEKIKVENETKLLQAKTDAEKKAIEAQAEADANKVISSSVTNEMNQYIEAQARLKHGWVEVQTQQAIVDTK
jgi:B-cell receptor associated protein-related protein|nr:MAG TPA: High frequency of lysogenization C protein [Caudoviricetes sp.]